MNVFPFMLHVTHSVNVRFYRYYDEPPAPSEVMFPLQEITASCFGHMIRITSHSVRKNATYEMQLTVDLFYLGFFLPLLNSIAVQFHFAHRSFVYSLARFVFGALANEQFLE